MGAKSGTGAGPARPAVWAIVLTHGGAEEITAACLTSLLAQDCENFTVLLVDNASYDGSGERLRQRFLGIQYLNTGGNFGYTGGNNRGMQYAMAHGADHLLVLNNDTVLEPACVSTLSRSLLEADRPGAVAPKILFFDLPKVIWYAGGDALEASLVGAHRGEMRPDDPAEPARLEPMTFATGCCLLAPAAVIRALGGFREDFFIYAEDLELSLRMTRAGYKLYYQPGARMLHREPPRTADPTPFQLRLRDRNRRRIARQHLGFLGRVRFWLWFYPTRLIRLAGFVARMDWGRVRAIIAGATEA